jgi:hypothetical protein
VVQHIGAAQLEGESFWCISWGILWIISIWVNYNDLTTTSLEIMVSKGNHPQMALIQVSEIFVIYPDNDFLTTS